MRAVLTAALAAVLLAPVAWGDAVTMPDGIELSGKRIEILEIRDGEVVVRVAYGDITIPRDRITGMKVDFDTRLARLKGEARDTARALYSLGRVCAQLEMGREAVAAYREALARDKVPEDILLPMAADLEGAGAWHAAHRAYTAYLKLHPDNADVAAKARAAASKASEVLPELEPLSTDAARIEISSAAPVTPNVTVEQPTQAVQPEQPTQVDPATQPEQPEPAPPPEIEEGLEAKPSWSTEAWGSTAEVSVGASKGTTDKMLRVRLVGAEKDKVAVMLEDDFDLTKKKSIEFDVFNFSKQRIDIAMAFITRPAWKFYESLPTTILSTGDAPKHVVVDLTSERFKSADTKWRHQTALLGKDKVIKLYFLLYTDVTGEWVFFNNIRFDPPDEPPAPGAPPPVPGGAPAAPAPPRPAAPAAPADPARLERVAEIMLKAAQDSAARGNWTTAQRLLERLKERYSATKIYQDQQAAIDELRAKVEANIPKKPEPAPEPQLKWELAPKGEPAPAPDPKPAPEAKPAPDPKPGPEAEPAPDPKPAPEAKPEPAPAPDVDDP